MPHISKNSYLIQQVVIKCHNIFFLLLGGWNGGNDTQRGRETRNEKNFSRVLDGATRMALMRALK